MASKSAKVARKSASASAPAAHRIEETCTFKRGKEGRVFRIDMKTRPMGKMITAAVGGRVKQISITR